jgi:putative PEP-CTERM system integral membrane protein
VLVEPVTASDLPEPEGMRLAVVLDRSRSMAKAADQVKAALVELEELAASGSEIEIFLTASKFRGEEPSRTSLADFEPDGLLFFGGQNAAELLAQFEALRNGETYDAVLVLTDDSGYELTGEDIEVPIPNEPVWMVHLAGDFPLGYDDGTLAAIQASGGGVTGSVAEAMIRLAATFEGQQNIGSIDVIDGYRWSTVTTGPAKAQAGLALAIPADDDFAAFGARRLILSEMQRQRGNLAQVDILDHLHDIAVEHSVVTPYSSMIVLINRDQERLLRLLEARGDRFQREYEEVGETTPENPFDVTGVPEPEEWLLLALAVGMLGWYIYTTRLKMQPQPNR